MEGRRVQKKAPKRNPLYLIFIGLCVAVLALAIMVLLLSIRLSRTNKELALAQSRLEQYQSGTVVPEQTQTAEESYANSIPEGNTETEGQSGEVLTVISDTGADIETETKNETKIGWLDLTGHREVQVAPQSVFDRYYTYYTTNGVNLRGGPGTDYDRVALLDFGTEVKGAAKDGGWTFVSVDDRFGWISSDYLSATRPEYFRETSVQTAGDGTTAEMAIEQTDTE